ncbi:hypothetical protein [Vibrio splendidus]|uniref:hypothetical protein n=1 Tax=Vibrio splendidus TaxID=29497 RepID=UPI00076A8D1A|nr:hypothetical protein [Vibrio splendidus]
MKLSPLTHQAYKRWITRDTWHTGHSNDMKLFFAFVQAYFRFTRGSHITGSMLKDDILTIYQIDHYEYHAIQYGNLFDNLVEFHSYSKNPYQ